MIRDGLALVAAVVVALTVSACGGGIGDPADETPETPETPAAGQSPAPATDGDLAGELTVFAAASLHVVFEDIAELFTAEHPAAEVAFSDRKSVVEGKR